MVVAAPRADVDRVAELLDPYDVAVVPGGDDRAASVVAALAVLPAEVDLVLVHDAARCLTPPAVVTRVVAALRAGAPAVVPVVPVADTVKRVADGVVVGTVARHDLRRVQTPQGFRRRVLERAHRSPDVGHTDDAGLVESLGVPVAVVDGHEEAFKVTGPTDLLLAEAVLAARG